MPQHVLPELWYACLCPQRLSAGDHRAGLAPFDQGDYSERVKVVIVSQEYLVFFPLTRNTNKANIAAGGFVELIAAVHNPAPAPCQTLTKTLTESKYCLHAWAVPVDATPLLGSTCGPAALVRPPANRSPLMQRAQSPHVTHDALDPDLPHQSIQIHATPVEAPPCRCGTAWPSCAHEPRPRLKLYVNFARAVARLRAAAPGDITSPGYAEAPYDCKYATATALDSAGGDGAQT